MVDEIYHVALGLTGAGKVMATADGLAEDVDACLNLHAHILTLRIGAGPCELKPKWVDLASALAHVPASYTIGLAFPPTTTVSSAGGAIHVAAIAKSGALANVLNEGGSLVVTLKAKLAQEQSPTWQEVAQELKQLGNAIYIAEMTCVGPRKP